MRIHIFKVKSSPTYKKMGIVRNASQQDLANYERVNFVSKVACSLCSSEVHVKDIRNSHKVLCNRCYQYKPSMERNNYFIGTQKTKEERLAIVKSDRTLRNGGKDGFFKANHNA